MKPKDIAADQKQKAKIGFVDLLNNNETSIIKFLVNSLMVYDLTINNNAWNVKKEKG